MSAAKIIHLTAENVSVVIAQIGDRLPVIAHWGARIASTDEDLRSFVLAEERPGMADISDLPYRPSILPEHSAGWFGRPGVELHRGGAAWAPRFIVSSIEVDGAALAGDITQRGAASVGCAPVTSGRRWSLK